MRIITALSPGRAPVGWLLGLAGLLGFLFASRPASAWPNDAPPPEVTVTIHVNNDSGVPGKPVNRRLLGNNIQWTTGGDGILRPGTLEFKQYLADPIVALSPTVMRYPGGALTDTYHWQAGVGPIGNRGLVENPFDGTKQTVYFGTKEFLTLCALVGVEPLISLNVVTGDAQEAADWVRQTNITGIEADGGGRFPSVSFWEIGNEPYLTGDRADLRLQPAEYARRANLFFQAVKQVDANIRVGIPVIGPYMAGYFPDVNVFKTFNQTVLPALEVPPDFLAVHDAYLPITFDTVPERASLYSAMAGGATLVKQDLDNLRAQAQTYFPDRTIPFALTEYNAWYTLNKPATDGYVASLTSAIYLADLLAMLAERNDMIMANFWSVLDDWMFGAISPLGNRRPGFQILSAFSDFLHGEIRDTTVDAPTFNAPAAGIFPGEANVPLASAMAVNDNGTIRILIINKDVANTRRTLVEFSEPIQPRLITRRELYTDDYFATFLEGGDAIAWKEDQLTLSNGELVADLKPHSIVILEILPQTASNPSPSLQAISPTSAAVAGGAFTLSVLGSGFVPESVVRWNENNQMTTFVSTHQLQASLPASTITTAGTNPVTVFSPTPGGGVSNALAFPVVDFSIAASPTSLSVNRGQSVTTTVTLPSQFGPFGKDVSLACSGLPSLSVCTFSPSTVTPGASAATSTLTISTSAGWSAVIPFPGLGQKVPLLAMALGLSMVALLGGTLRSPKRRYPPSLICFGMLLAVISMQAACGGGGKSSGGGSPGTPAGTYTVTVTGTSSNVSHQVGLTLKVN